MQNADAHLVEELFSPENKLVPTRDGFGLGVVEAGQADERVVLLCADLAESTRADLFQKEFPERFVEVGIAEQNMAALASGMSAAGKVPFITSYAAFNPGRNYEQIRTTIALNGANVKVCGMHAGVSVGPDGATHQMLEDIGLMRMLPSMTVLVPADAEEARKATVAAAQVEGPVYLRFGRFATPSVTTAETPFQIGKALTLWNSAAPKVAILSTGSLAHTALLAARALAVDGVETLVVHFATVKPLDAAAVLAAASTAGRVVTLEEHQAAGGFGSTVAELLAECHPVPMRLVAVRDQFGQSGTPTELLEHYGLDTIHVQGVVKSLL